MATHKARSLKGTAGILIACAALILSVIGSGSAQAAAGKTVKPKNADVLSTCTLTVMSVNPSTGQAQIRITAAAQPATLFGYANNAYTQTFCAVYDSSNNLVQFFAPFRNGATLPTTSITPIVSYSSSYSLCGQGFVKKTSGNQSLTPVVCA